MFWTLELQGGVLGVKQRRCLGAFGKRHKKHSNALSRARFFSFFVRPRVHLSQPPLLFFSSSLSLSKPENQQKQPDGGEWVRRLRRHQEQQRQKQQRQQKQRKPQPPASSSSSGAGNGGNSSSRGPAPPRVASRAPPISSSLRPHLPSRNNNKSNESSSEPRCPLRDWPVLGSLLPLAAGGETLGLNCPQAIVQLRAAVARVPQVRGLRPRPVWVKGAAVLAAGAAANAPFGAWRSHTRKFSLEWFVAVHATVPFVAALRQATLLPRWALLLTVAGAVAGQMVGAKVEEARVRGVEERRKRREEEEKEETKKTQRWRRRKASPAPAPAQRVGGGGFTLPPFLLRAGGAGSAAALQRGSSSSSIVVV